MSLPERKTTTMNRAVRTVKSCELYNGPDLAHCLFTLLLDVDTLRDRTCDMLSPVITKIANC